MKIGIEQHIEQHKDIDISESMEQFGEGLIALEKQSDTINRVNDLCDVLAVEGYNPTIEHLFGQELRDNGVDTSMPVNKIIEHLTGCKVATEGIMRQSVLLILFGGTGFMIALITLLEHILHTSEVKQVLAKPSLLLTPEDITKVGHKRIPGISFDYVKKYFTPAIAVLNMSLDAVSTGKLDMVKFKVLSKQLDITLFQKNPKLWNFSFKPTRLAQKGWGNANNINLLHKLLSGNINKLYGNLKRAKKAGKNVYHEGMSPEDTALVKQTVKQAVAVVQQSYNIYSKILFRRTTIIKNNS
jgi:hypothetical protein